MSKAGLIVLTKAVAREYGPHGIRVFSLSPPSMDSEMQRSLPEEQRERVRSMNALDRLASPEEVARFTLLTASGAGRLVTGTMVDLTATSY
jgi:NAD(P)-dependent dehydrogenase (short-subunit alcohol dehydrogenase family)